MKKVIATGLASLFAIAPLAFAQTADTAPVATPAPAPVTSPAPAATGEAMSGLEAQIKTLRQQEKAEIEAIHNKYGDLVKKLRGDAMAAKKQAMTDKKAAAETARKAKMDATLAERKGKMDAAVAARKARMDARKPGMTPPPAPAPTTPPAGTAPAATN